MKINLTVLNKINKAKIINSFLLFASLFFIFTNLTYAAENFSTSYNVVYEVKEDETTRVNLYIALTNKVSERLVTGFGIQTGYVDAKNIYVSDETGALEYTTEKNDDGVQISFDFVEKSAGKGNTKNFSISFDTNNISKNYGTVWEVNIPGIANQEEYDAFNVVVKTPETFGKPTIIKPNVANLKSDTGTISFTKNALGGGGISIAFGDYQTYQFNLKYHITNKNVFPEVTEIAIPSDNSYQNVSIDKIEPKPKNVVIDKDGNWLARYKLLPSQDLTITVTGRSKIYYLPKTEELSAEQKKLYLSQQKFWDVKDPNIQKLAKELKTPKNIYDYVVKSLKYDTERISGTQIRAGAKKILKEPESAVCLEFTDLFITLARAAGIPARAVEGYANTNNTAYRPLSLVEDVLHAWPQYYDVDKKAWVMVDPTWGNTTNGIDYFNVLDFDHFAFVIKGVESDYPIPAGGYKSNTPKEQKDVNVATLEKYDESEPSVNISTDFPKNLYGGLPLSGSLVIVNDSKVITPSQTIKVEVEGLSPEAQNLILEQIPPYGNKVIPINFSPVHPLTNNVYKAKISIGDQVLTKEIIILPFYRSIYFAYFLGGVLSALLLLTISFIIYRTRRIHFPK